MANLCVIFHFNKYNRDVIQHISFETLLRLHYLAQCNTAQFTTLTWRGSTVFIQIVQYWRDSSAGKESTDILHSARPRNKHLNFHHLNSFRACIAVYLKEYLMASEINGKREKFHEQFLWSTELSNGDRTEVAKSECQHCAHAIWISRSNKMDIMQCSAAWTRRVTSVI